MPFLLNNLRHLCFVNRTRFLSLLTCMLTFGALKVRQSVNQSCTTEPLMARTEGRGGSEDVQIISPLLNVSVCRRACLNPPEVPRS